jgi:hypothetical protein
MTNPATTPNSAEPVADLSDKNWINSGDTARLLGKTSKTLANQRNQKRYEGENPTIPRHFELAGRIRYWRPSVVAFIARRLSKSIDLNAEVQKDASA